MGSLKDDLNLGAKQFTLTPEEIAYLSDLNHFLQVELDQIQQLVAAKFLHHVAVTKFGYKEGQDLRFNLEANKTTDNLTITQVAG